MQPSGNHGHGLTAESNCDHGRATRASISAQGPPSHDISRLRRRRCRGRRAIRRQILIIVLVLVWRQPLDDCVFLVRGRFLLGAREIGRRPRATQAAEAAEAALWCLQQRPAALPALPGSTRHHGGRGGAGGGGGGGGGGSTLPAARRSCPRGRCTCTSNRIRPSRPPPGELGASAKASAKVKVSESRLCPGSVSSLAPRRRSTRTHLRRACGA